MATPRIKSTYTMDLETTRLLDRLAQRWRVSKSEALRRAIRSAAGGASSAGSDALEALDALQGSADLSADAARRWSGDSRKERRASSRRGEGRSPR
jgi:hypothetical protein